MIEAVYALIVVIFASLIVLALFSHLIHGNELREAMAELKDTRSQVDGRLAQVKSEFDILKFESNTMDDERVALEKQARCLLDLEEDYKMTQAAALDAEDRRRR